MKYYAILRAFGTKCVDMASNKSLHFILFIERLSASRACMLSLSYCLLIPFVVQFKVHVVLFSLLCYIYSENYAAFDFSCWIRQEERTKLFREVR